MEMLSKPILDSVLEIISATDESIDIQALRYKVIDVFFNAITADGVVFIPPDLDKLREGVLLKNHDPKYIIAYQNYYHQFDPLNLCRMENKILSIELLENIVNYDSFQSTEYYADFLKPQKIHYKLITNLVTDANVQGKIVLTRSKKSGHFNSNDIKIAKQISPYLSHALLHHSLRRKVKLFDNIINYLENQSLAGMILLDQGFKVLYINKKAEEFIKALYNDGFSDNPAKIVEAKLLGDCREIKSKLKITPISGMVLPKRRVLKGRCQKRFSVVTKTFDSTLNWKTSRLFVIGIEELPGPNYSKWQYLMNAFNLSPREIDVIPHLFSELKNAEIAEKLFVSEITIKKHLQSIYAKMGVKNRTSLILKLLARQPTEEFSL
jgi:DNA-binding CsgD family transcriptional regulator